MGFPVQVSGVAPSRVGKRLSDRLLSEARRPVGVWSPMFGLVNALDGTPITATSTLITAPNTVGPAWHTSSGAYVEVGPTLSKLQRSSSLPREMTVIGIAQLNSADGFPMLFSANSNTADAKYGHELRCSSTTGRPQYVVDIGIIDAAGTVGSSVIGAGPLAFVGTFRGSRTGDTTPSRAAVWVGRQFAEGSAGSGEFDITTDSPSRIGERANVGGFPWPGSINLVILMDGAISDRYAAEIASAPARQAMELLFAPRRIWVPVTAAPTGLPTLSSSTYKPGSLTSSGWTARITAS